MPTEIYIVIAVALAAGTLGAAVNAGHKELKGRAWLAVALCCEAGLVGVAWMGPDAHLHWTLPVAAVVAAIAAVLLGDTMASDGHVIMAAAAGIMVTLLVGGFAEKRLAPDYGWEISPDELLAWGIGAVAGTIVVALLRLTWVPLAPKPLLAVIGVWSVLAMAVAVALESPPHHPLVAATLPLIAACLPRYSLW